MTGYEYEKKCAELLKTRGFTDVCVTPGSGDQGIDILAKKSGKKYGIQCKYYEGNVGNKAVQEAFAGASFYDCDVAIVITNSSFTRAAEEMAIKLGVELWSDINAITFFENTNAVDENVPPEEKEKTEVTHLEQKLQEKYRKMKERFPENAAKDAEITEFVEIEKQNLANRHQRHNDRLEAITEAEWKKGYNLSIQERKKYDKQRDDSYNAYMIALCSMLEDADMRALEYVKYGVSENSAEKLASLIRLIYNSGYSDKWKAKHKRVADKWAEFENQLPNVLKRRHQKEEAKECGYHRQNVSNAKLKIIKLRTDIEQLEGDIASRDGRMAELSGRAKEIEDEKARVRASLVQRTGELEKELKSLEIELSNTNTRLEEINAGVIGAERELSNLSVFALKAKSEIRSRIESLGNEKSDISSRCAELSEQIDNIKTKYRILTDEIQNSIDMLDEKNRAIKKEIEEIRRNITETELRKKLLELLALIVSLPVLEAKVRTAHKLFLKKVLEE